MAIFTGEDINQMSWQEFDELISILIDQITKYFKDKGEEVSIIAPLLRTGGIVGGILSIKMKILPMLPVQFKYSYNPTRINQLLSVPDILTKTSEPMNILLCEGNTSSGATVIQAANAIKGKYPQSKVYLATLTKVYGSLEKLEGIEKVFFGRMTDENFKASTEQKLELNLRPGITIFPWENVDDELADINAALK